MTSKLVVNEIAADTGISTITVGDNMSGVTFKTGTSNLHNVGIEIAGINVLGADTPIGAGATIYNSGDVLVGGAVTATAFSGSGASLTALNGSNIASGTVADARISTLTASKLSGALPAISGASLTNLPTQVTIANNSDDRVITGGSGVNLNGEQRLTFNSSNILTATETGTGNGMGGIRAATANAGGNAGYGFMTNSANRFAVTTIGSAGAESLRVYDDNNNLERLRIDSSGNVLVGTTDSTIYNNGDPQSEGIVLRNGKVIDIARNGDLQLTLNRKTNDGPHIGFYRSGVIKSFISTKSNSFCISTGDTIERLRIDSAGRLKINHVSTVGQLDDTWLSIYDANTDSSANDPEGISKNYAMINLHNYGTGIPGDATGIGFGAGAAFTYTKGSIAFTRSGSYGTGDLVFLTNNDQDSTLVNDTDERMRITREGDIYGPGGGRKNWFDNGSFDCTYGGRKANTSMDYGNHHAYGWVTDRWMSRNSVQWSRSTNVPAGKGFSYSTQTNGAGGVLMQAVELPDYGDMGVFVPNSYWCVSFWSTSGCNQGGQAFSYDLGSTKTGIPIVHPSGSGAYQTTGETASGTSTGTFSRYYMVFQMPSSIISGATGAYWQWGFTAAGYVTGFQLERVPTSTSKPTPYEHVHPSVTIARCRRYAYRVYNSRHVCGWKRHDTGVNWECRHPVLPTHMPSGSNQSVDPYGIILHTAGMFTNFQGIWQNPGVTSLSRYGFNPADGSFILNGQSNYSGTHVVIPSYEGFEYEVQHGFF